MFVMQLVNTDFLLHVNQINKKKQKTQQQQQKNKNKTLLLNKTTE